MLRHKVLTATGIGLLLGILAGTGEVLHLKYFTTGASIHLELWVLAWLIDGAALGAVGFVIGVLWALLSPRPRVRAIPVTYRRGQPSLSTSRRRGTSRRTLLRLAATGVASAGVLGLAARAATSAPQTGGPSVTSVLADALDPAEPVTPNVLLITVDTLRADQLGCYGHPYVKTPAMDGLARQGARFGMHLVQEPQTNPSHASMLTGMYPSSSGVRIHMVDKLPNNLDTLATIFQKNGYATAALYSWMSFDAQYSNFQRGFQVYRDLTTEKGSLLSQPLVAEAAAKYRVAEQYLVLPKMAVQTTSFKSQVEGGAKGVADKTTDAAIAQIKAFGKQPFFMWLHYFDPHYPYQPPDAYTTLYDPSYTGKLSGDIQTVDAIMAGQLKPSGEDLQRLVALYQGEISYFDSQVSRLFAAIDQLGLTQNTVIALSGDHGEGFAEHTDFEEDINYFHPHSLYNDEGRVPLLLRYPPMIKPGTVTNVPTQAIDIFPTLLELAGLPIPDQSQGRSLTGLLNGADDGSSRAALSSMPDYVFTSIAVPGWKLIQNNASGQRRLYNLANDPQELTDVLTANADTADQLTARLKDWMKQVKISS